MSLPPYNHSRNSALEKENEFEEYAGSAVPLITHSGVVERRKTTDRKLVRSQPPHNGVEFEYLPILSSSGSAITDAKNNASKSALTKKKTRDKNCPSVRRNDEDKKTVKSIGKENEAVKEKNAKKIDEKNSEVAKEVSQSLPDDRQSCKRCKSTVNRDHGDESPRSIASNKSIRSEKSTRSASTVVSVTSTIKDAIGDKRQAINRRESSTPEFHFLANGLDEEDQFPRKRR